MIVFLAPYDRSETTAAAIRLADLAAAAGQRVRYVAVGDQLAGIDPRWDKLATFTGGSKGSFNRVKDLASKADLFVHFRGAIDLILAAALTSPTATHLLVGPPEDGLSLLADDASLFACSVCSSKSLSGTAAMQLWRGRPKAGALRTVYWTSGLAFAARDGLVESRVIRLAIWADASIAERSRELVDFCAALLADAPALRISIASTCSWRRRDRRRLRELIKTGKASWLRPVGSGERRRVFAEHDAVFFASTRPRFGLFATEAAACGAVPIAWKAPPYSEFLQDGKQSILLPCEVGIPNDKFPEVSPKFPEAIRRCGELFRSPHEILRIQPHLATLKAYERPFLKDWGEFLSLPS